MDLDNLKIETLPSIPPNSNPFHHDRWNMGQAIGEDLYMMFSNHDSQPMEFMILVDTKTGKRVKIS